LFLVQHKFERRRCDVDNSFDEERRKRIDKRKELKRELFSGGLKGSRSNFDPLNSDSNFILEDKSGIAEFNANINFEIKKIEESSLSIDDKLIAISKLEQKTEEFWLKFEKRFNFDVRNTDQFEDEIEAIEGLEGSFSKISNLKFAFSEKSHKKLSLEPFFRYFYINSVKYSMSARMFEKFGLKDNYDYIITDSTDKAYLLDGEIWIPKSLCLQSRKNNENKN
jgi:hypothetical protein